MRKKKQNHGDGREVWCGGVKKKGDLAGSKGAELQERAIWKHEQRLSEVLVRKCVRVLEKRRWDEWGRGGAPKGKKKRRPVARQLQRLRKKLKEGVIQTEGCDRKHKGRRAEKGTSWARKRRLEPGGKLSHS